MYDIFYNKKVEFPALVVERLTGNKSQLWVCSVCATVCMWKRENSGNKLGINQLAPCKCPCANEKFLEKNKDRQHYPSPRTAADEEHLSMRGHIQNFPKESLK